jgi:ATP phosphoribosyltransferase-like protein
MSSSTRMYANRQAMEKPLHRGRIEQLALLLRSVMTARERVLLEVNVPVACLEQVVAILPCMRQPTVAELHNGAGFAVRVAVPRRDLPTLIPDIKSRGGTDLLVSHLSQIVP